MLIRWTDKFVTNIKEIDDQHKKLIDLINEFYGAVKENRAKEAQGKLLSGVVDYAKYHFKTEEALMRQYGYIESEDHENAHRSFEAQVADFYRRSMRGGMVLPVELTNYLRDWLQGHILSTDQELGAFLRKKNVR